MDRVLSLTTTEWRSFYETQLAALAAQEIEVTTREPPGEYRGFEDDVQRRSMTDYLRFYGSVLRESIRDYDLIHANYGLTAPIALAQPIRPVVVSLWGGEFFDNTYAHVIRTSVNRADEVVVPSEAMGRNLGRDHHVIPFPVDTERFRPIAREEARRHVGWETDAPVVLFPAARAREVKNYPLAERVVAALDEEVELRSIVNEPHEQMPYYLNASDALLVTSRWESGPMVVKEAMACNVPVVSTDVGFVSDVLDGIAHSHVCESEPELVAALEEVVHARERANGRERIASYDIEAMGTRLCEVYERAHASRQGSMRSRVQTSDHA